MKAAIDASGDVGVLAAVTALGVSRATVHRRLRPAPPPTQGPRPPPVKRLTSAQEEQALAHLHEPRFVDSAPETIVATLLDEGEYVASARTLYRLLKAHGEVKERRDQLRHERYAVPRLEAAAPNRVWSWDITKLRGPLPGILFMLYVVLDIFSRYVVGWMLADRESSDLAITLFEETCHRQQVVPDLVALHADRGAVMRSKPLGEKLAELGVVRSFSRPRVSNDNPYSESQFKTFKYRPEFPDRFGSIQHAREHADEFFRWYNDAHRHSGIAYLTPADVHHGRAAAVLEKRQRVLERASAAHPERFAGGRGRVLTLPGTVWINPPTNVIAVESVST